MVMLGLFCQAAFEAVLPLPAAFRLLGQTMAAAGRIFSLADEPPAVREPQEPAPGGREDPILGACAGWVSAMGMGLPPWKVLTWSCRRGARWPWSGAAAPAKAPFGPLAQFPGI